MVMSRDGSSTGISATPPAGPPAGPPAPATAMVPASRSLRRALARITQNVALGRPPAVAIAVNKMAFGPRPGEIASIADAGLPAYIEQQLYPETIDDSALDARLAALGITTLQNADVPTLWARKALKDSNEQWRAYMETLNITWMRAIFSNREFLEVLVDHWHNHFNVFAPTYPIYLIWTDHDRRIRKNVFGNFRLFLEEIAQSTAMLYYLDNSSNQVAGPNENYGRELFELHTMGAAAYTPGIEAPTPGQTYEGYRDFDVYEAARCFTGWTVRNRSWDTAVGDTGEFYYRQDWHDRFSKYVLNNWIQAEQPPLKDGRDVLDRLASHPATALNVVTRLARRLVSDTPSESVIQAGVDAFLANRDKPDQLRHVYRAILTHGDFTTVWGEKIKRPFEMMVSVLRATNTQWTWTSSFDYYSGQVGQALWEWPSPNGYPDVRQSWSSSIQLIQRFNFTNSICNDQIDGAKPDLAAQMPASVQSPRDIVNFWVARLLGYTLSEPELQPLYDYVASGRNLDIPLSSDVRARRVAGVAALILQSPAAQLR